MSHSLKCRIICPTTFDVSRHVALITHHYSAVRISLTISHMTKWEHNKEGPLFHSVINHLLTIHPRLLFWPTACGIDYKTLYSFYVYIVRIARTIWNVTKREHNKKVTFRLFNYPFFNHPLEASFFYLSLRARTISQHDMTKREHEEVLVFQSLANHLLTIHQRLVVNK